MNAELVDIDDPRLVKALAHPIRLKILNILDQKTATPKELAALLGLPLENVSYHVRTLKDFGFIKLERTRQVRGAVEHHYRLAARPRIGNKLWEEIPRIVQEALADAGISVMIETIGQAALQGGFDRGDAHVVRHTLNVDDEGFKEASDILDEAQARIEEVQAKAAKRLAGAPGTNITATFFLFETAEQLPPEQAAKARDAKRRSRQASTA